MSIGSLIFVPMVVVATTLPAPTYGLPACTGTHTGLTERYETNTLYVDDCIDGNVIEENLPIVDLTASAVVIMTSRGLVTIHLPE